MRWGSVIVTLIMTATLLKAQNKENLTNQSVISLVKAGLDKSTILATVNNAPSKFDVSATAIINLKKQGVPTDVINAMIEKLSSGNNTKPTAKPQTSQLDLPMANHPYLKNGNKLQPLDKSIAGLRTKSKAFGYGGATIQYEIDGTKAATRINQTDSATFLINTGGTAIPELVLYKLEVKKDKRAAIGSEVKVLGGMKAGKNIIAFNLVNVATGIYKIVPMQALDAGEYFFGGKPVQSAMTIDVFAFGVQ